VSDLLPLRNTAGRNQQAGLFAAGGKICPASPIIKWLFPRGPCVREHSSDLHVFVVAVTLSQDCETE
jgi:hypothetical protein